MVIPLLHDTNGKQLLHDSTDSLMHDKNSSRNSQQKEKHKSVVNSECQTSHLFEYAMSSLAVTNTK